MPDNVTVAIRCRPFNKREKNMNSPGCVKIVDKKNIRLEGADGNAHQFGFDYVYGENTEQELVFNDLGVPILDAALSGFNGTIFAYGQTGSGKTWSMTGIPEQEGIIPRLNRKLFQRIKEETEKKEKQFLVEASYFEIYNEIIYDLLDPTRKAGTKSKENSLQIKESKALGIYVKGLRTIVVESWEKVEELLDQGNKMRTASATKMNARSSRSHSIFILKIQQKDVANPQRVVFAALNLVDLAGSERASKTEATGARLKEGANINKSLMSLGNVINALAENANHGGKKKIFIPYRNSKLTRVLQNSLGGNSLCSMLATTSPALDNLEESLSTLNYANRAKMIKVEATKNEEMTQIDALKDEVTLLKQKLQKMATQPVNVGGGLADQEKMKMKAEYEAQLQELKSHMNQNWEDKSSKSKKYEKERQLLLAKNREEQKQLQRQFELEKQKRWALMEEKGDIEGMLRELKRIIMRSGGISAPGNDGNNNTNNQEDGAKKKNSIKVDELDVWLSMVAEARRAEAEAKDQKTLLLVYKNAFEADLNALNGQDQQHIVPGSSPGGTPPASRVKAIVDQAQSKLLTLSGETKKWSAVMEKVLSTAKRVARAMQMKLGPPPRSPTKNDGKTVNGNSTPSPSPSVSSQNSELPFGTIEDEVAQTRELLKDIVPGPKPPLSTKLLTRPPFRYLDDLISAVTKTTGFGKGLFVGLEPKEGQKQRSREVKVQYLDRLIICIGLGLGRPVDCVPSHVVAGSESEKTNRMLQHLAKVAMDEKLNFDSLVERTLNGDKPKGHEVQQKLAKARKNGDGNDPNEADQYNGLPKEQGDVIQRALKMMRNIWLSSKTLQHFKRETSNMTKIGQPAAQLARTLRLEGKYWQEDDNDLSIKLNESATTVEPPVPLPPGAKAEQNKEKNERTFDGYLNAFNLLQGSLSRRIKKMHEDSKASKASNEAKLLELESAHSTLQRDLQAKDEAIEELTNNLKSLAAEKAKLQTSESEWRQKGEDMQREISRVESESEALKQSVSEGEYKIKELQESMKKSEEQRVENEKNTLVLKEHQIELESLNASLKAQLETSGEEQQAIEKMQGDLAAAKGKLEAARLDAERVEKDVEKLEETRDRLEEELSKSQIALSAAKSQCQDWEQKTMASEQNFKRLQEEHVAVSEENKKREEAIEVFKVKLEEASRERGNADAAKAKAMAEVINLKDRIKSMADESESTLAKQQESVELQTTVLSLQAEKKILVSRCDKLEAQLKNASSTESNSEKLKKEVEVLTQRLTDMEDENAETVTVLTEERDAARRKEEEYYMELQTRLQDLEDTQAGYVDLSDRLNDKVDQIYDLEEKASNYKDQNEILLARALRAEADLASAKIELDRKPTNTAPLEGSNKEEKEEGEGNGNIGSSDKNKMDEEIAALHEELKTAKAEAIKLEERAAKAEGDLEQVTSMEKEITDLKTKQNDLTIKYDEQSVQLRQAEEAAVNHMNTLAEHMKKSDDAINSLESQLDKARADVDKWENRAVEAEAELMEIEERKLDEKIAKEQREEEKKKKANSEFTGISEIADETIVGGSGINAVRHLQYGGVNNDDGDDNYDDDDFDDGDDYDDEYDDDDFN